MIPFFLVGEMGRGGQEQQLRYMLMELRKAERPCGVIIWDTIPPQYQKFLDELVGAGVEVLSLPAVVLFEKLKQSSNFIKRHNATVIQSFTFYLNFYTALIGIMTGLPTIGGIRGNLNLAIESCGFFKFFLCSLYPVKKISNNRSYRKEFRFPLLNGLFIKTIIVTNQLDMKGRVYKKKQAHHVIHTCSLSRLYPEKDIPLMIEAIKIVKLKGYDVHHKHAGKGPLLEELKLQVNQSGLNDSFQFVGEIEDTTSFIQSADIFLHTSRSEGFPNVIMEAMACGRAILTTRCGDAEDLVENGRNGFHVPTKNLQAFTSQLCVLIKDKNLLEKMGKESFEMAVKHFGIHRLVQDTFNAYEKFGIIRHD